jgi:hypothetical protein
MATTVGQHSVATFTSPVNGTTPIDANTVRGNDNTMRTAYVDHDADPGIHVQSSTLASRPVAGTAGRKWITEDSGVYTLWFDDGSNWHPVSSENVALTVLATQALNKGDVVKVVGWNNGQDLPEVAKVASSSDIAFAVMSANATINTMGYAVNTGILQDVATNTFSVGDILYPNTSGGFTATKPTSGIYQPVAFVLRSNASNGVIYVEFSAPRIVERSDNTASTLVLRDASGNFSAGTITASLTGSISGNAATATALQTARNINGVSFNGTADITVTAAAGTLTGSTLASGVTASSLTSIGTLSSLTVSGDLTVDTSTLKVDSANNRVGVGTASPLAQFHVKGATDKNVYVVRRTSPVDEMRVESINDAESAYTQLAITGSPLLFRVAGGAEAGRFDATGLGVGTTPSYKLHVKAATDENVGILSAATGDLRLLAINDAGSATVQLSIQGSPLLFRGAGGAIRATLDASGNLGLGVTPSAWSASFKAIQNGNSGWMSRTSSDDMYLTGNAYFDGSWKYIYSAYATRYEQGTGAHKWFTAPSGTAGNAITFTQAMTLDASGTLTVKGIGAGNGNLIFDDTGTAIVSAQGSGASALTLNGRNIITFTTGGTPSGGTERARFTSGGYFKASDNGTYIGSTGTYHELSNSANDVGLAILNSNASFTSAVALIRASRAASGAFNLISAQSNLVEQFVVSGSGIIYAQNTTVQSVSDARLKENVRNATEGLAIINALRPVRYDWKAGHGNDRTNQLGFIAQEVEAVFADAVSEWKMGEEIYKTVGPGALIPVLVNAIKELSSRVAALEAQ